jgi:quinol monooxygenase YgiN
VIHVLATVELRPDTREKFLHEFSLLRSQVLAEHGCVEYGAAVDFASGLAAQPSSRPNVAVIVEKWTSIDTLKAHLAAPHMGAFRDRMKAYVVKTNLQVLEPVD